VFDSDYFECVLYVGVGEIEKIVTAHFARIRQTAVGRDEVHLHVLC
jgi:hypothetical protein